MKPRLALVAIALVVDAVSDPWVGIWSDRIRTRWGRRHPFMYAAILPFAAAYYFILIDPGDITETGALWHFGGKDFNRTISTAAVHEGILYVADLSGFFYALDQKTGEHLWTHDTFAAIWGSGIVVDDKIYLGDEDGDVVILETGREEKVIGEFNMGSAVYTTPAFHDGVMYVATRSELFAIRAE